MIPVLRLGFLFADVRFGRDRRGQHLQVDRLRAEHFNGHAQRDEVDEGALATAWAAGQYELALCLEPVENGPSGGSALERQASVARRAPRARAQSHPSPCWMSRAV